MGSDRFRYRINGKDNHLLRTVRNKMINHGHLYQDKQTEGFRIKMVIKSYRDIISTLERDLEICEREQESILDEYLEHMDLFLEKKSRIGTRT